VNIAIIFLAAATDVAILILVAGVHH